MTDDNDEVAKVILPDGRTVDEFKFPRPSLVLDEFFTEGETFTGDKAGLLEAAAELVARRNKGNPNG